MIEVSVSLCEERTKQAEREVGILLSLLSRVCVRGEKTHVIVEKEVFVERKGKDLFLP